MGESAQFNQSQSIYDPPVPDREINESEQHQQQRDLLRNRRTNSQERQVVERRRRLFCNPFDTLAHELGVDYGVKPKQLHHRALVTEPQSDTLWELPESLGANLWWILPVSCI